MPDHLDTRPHPEREKTGLKIDLKVDRKDLYAPSRGVFTEVTVPPMTNLAVEGSGDPNVSIDHTLAIEALFAASYAVKFSSKNDLGRDYVVLPLEAQWWARDMTTFRTREKEKWSWRVMIRQPGWMVADGLQKGAQVAQGKGPAP